MAEQRQPNPVLDLVLTVLLPSLALEWLSSADCLGPSAPIWALVVASALPLGYGVYCWATNEGLNFFSVFGLVAIILTGGLGLLKLDTFWFAFKEASVPVVLGICFPLSYLIKRPLVDALLLNPQLLNVKLVRSAVAEEPGAGAFQQLLWRSSLAIGGMMLISAAMNFALAWYLLNGKLPQTPEHNSALSKLNWGGMIVIGVPMMSALWFVMIRFIGQLERITGLERADFLEAGRTVRRQVG